MIQTRPYEFMVKYTPQKEWSEGVGIMITFAFSLGGICGGLYIVSLYFNSMAGMFISWLLALLMGMVDITHLTKPKRFWRMLLKPKSSWIARGFIFIMLFIGCAATQLALSFWIPGIALETVFKTLAGIMALGVAIYSGFVVGYVGAIKIWNSAIVPIIFAVTSLTGGLAIMLAINLVSNPAQTSILKGIIQLMLIVYAIILAAYLWITTYASQAAKDSVIRIVKGNIAPIFWVGVVLLGIIAPITTLSAAGCHPAALLFIVACVIIGGITLRYVILKAGMYSPLVPA